MPSVPSREFTADVLGQPPVGESGAPQQVIDGVVARSAQRQELEDVETAAIEIAHANLVPQRGQNIRKRYAFVGLAVGIVRVVHPNEPPTLVLEQRASAEAGHRRAPVGDTGRPPLFVFDVVILHGPRFIFAVGVADQIDALDVAR